MYPHRTEEEQSALKAVHSSPYHSDDKPYLSTKRYSLSGYEPHQLNAKVLVDVQGIKDNAYWYGRNNE